MEVEVLDEKLVKKKVMCFRLEGLTFSQLREKMFKLGYKPLTKCDLEVYIMTLPSEQRSFGKYISLDRPAPFSLSENKDRLINLIVSKETKKEVKRSYHCYSFGVWGTEPEYSWCLLAKFLAKKI